MKIKGKNWAEMDISLGIVSLSQKAVLAKNLSVMLQAGLSIIEAIDIARGTATGKLNKVLGRVRESVSRGNSLSKALREWPLIFSEVFVSAVEAGEESGSLDEKLVEVSKQLDKEYELVKKVKGAMLYPLIVLIATFILGLVLAFVVLPRITPLFEGLQVDLPITTRGLIWFSHLIQNNGFSLMVGIVAFVLGWWWVLRRQFMRPITNWVLLKVPLIRGVVKNTNISRFCRTFGTMMDSGLSVDKAMVVAGDTVTNYHYQKAIDEVGNRIREGTKISKNLDKYPELFPTMVRRMIQVGEEAGKLDDNLLYLADYYEAEVDGATKSLSNAVEPVMLVFIGLVVGFLALSIITPIYDVTGNINQR